MRGKIKDPMLMPLRDPKKRIEELRLLAEYEMSGKIRRIDYRTVDDKKVLFGFSDDRLEELGDGNFRIMKVDEIRTPVVEVDESQAERTEEIDS